MRGEGRKEGREREGRKEVIYIFGHDIVFHQLISIKNDRSG